MLPLRHTYLSIGLLLGLAVATQSACNKDTTTLATDGLRGDWYLREVIGGFRAGAAPGYTLKDSPERLSFGESQTFMYQRFDTLGEQSYRSEHKYEIVARAQEPFGDTELTKLTVRYTPEVDDLTLSEIWLEDGMLSFTRYAPAYDGTAKFFARVSD